MKRADALRMEREKRKTKNEMGGLCDERLGRVGGRAVENKSVREWRWQ